MVDELLSGAFHAKVILVEAVTTLLRFVGAGKTVKSIKEDKVITVTVIIMITIIIDDIDDCFRATAAERNSVCIRSGYKLNSK